MNSLAKRGCCEIYFCLLDFRKPIGHKKGPFHCNLSVTPKHLRNASSHFLPSINEGSELSPEKT